MTNQANPVFGQFRFEINVAFSGDTLNVGNPSIFSIANSKSFKPKKLIGFNHAHNPFIDNELRGFVQHRAIEAKNTATTICTIVHVINNTIIPFIDECYPEISSFSQMDNYLEKFKQFCVEKNISQVSHCVHFHADNTVKSSRHRSRNFSVLDSIHKFIFDTIHKESDDIMMRDQWRLADLPVISEETKLKSNRTINFSCFTHPWLKTKIKHYSYYCIQKGESIESIKNKYKSFKKLDQFLRENGFSDLSNFSHADVLNYIKCINTQGTSSSYLYRHLSNLRLFCEWGFWAFPDDFPNSEIVKKTDMPKTVSKEPKIYSANEIERLNRLLPELPLIAARATLLMEYCGLRFSDLSTTPILIEGHLCITETTDGKSIFEYYMRKSRRFNRQPISKEMADLIKEQIQNSKSLYGEDCKYIFAEGKNYGYKIENYRHSTQMVTAKFKPVTDNGEPLRFMPHTFRRTYASKLANSGVDADTIRALLGQKSLDVQMKHYVTIHSETMSKQLEPLLKQDEALIKNLGRIDMNMIMPPDNFSDFIPLPNGSCSCGGDCPNQNACYLCPFYLPMKDYIPVYQIQLARAEEAIEAAKAGKHTSYYNKMVALRDSLKNIIEKVKDK